MKKKRAYHVRYPVAGLQRVVHVVGTLRLELVDVGFGNQVQPKHDDARNHYDSRYTAHNRRRGGEILGRIRSVLGGGACMCSNCGHKPHGHVTQVQSNQRVVNGTITVGARTHAPLNYAW